MGNDPEQKEDFSPKEYLVYPYELPAEFDADHLIEAKSLIPISELIEILTIAQEHIEDTPGPNQTFRREHSDSWLGWWSRYLRQYDNSLHDSNPGRKLLTLKEVQERALSQGLKGVWLANLFANSMEGHPGHRAAAEQMAIQSPSNVLPGLFIDRVIDPTKERANRYLPLGVILSLWGYWRVEYQAQFLELDHIALMPPLPEGSDPDLFYWAMFMSSMAKYHFVVTGDPNFERKVLRNPHGQAILEEVAVEEKVDWGLVEDLLLLWDGEPDDPFEPEYLMPQDPYDLPRATWMIIERAGAKDRGEIVPRTSRRIERLAPPVIKIPSEPILDYWKAIHTL